MSVERQAGLRFHLSNSQRYAARPLAFAGAGRRPFPSSFSLAGEGHGAPGRRRGPGAAGPLADWQGPPLRRWQGGACPQVEGGGARPALHPGAFCSGSRKLLAPAFAPKLERQARSRVVLPGRRFPGPPEPAVTSRGRRTPDPAPSSGSPREHGPSSSETACLYYTCIMQSIQIVVERITFP